MSYHWERLSEAKRAVFSARKVELLEQTNAFAPVAAGERVYYISSRNGSDENAGTSPAAAWKTCQPLKDNLTAGDTVLFECGSAFRESVPTVNGVTYASYGEGEKPRFYGSIDAAHEEDWEPIGTNLYRYRGEIDKYNDIGNLVFNDGEAWGIKIQKRTDAEAALGLCKVSNGKDYYEQIVSYPFRSGADLSGQYDLSYFHGDDNRVYLVCRKGNPGKVFRKIELSQSVKIFQASNAEDITVCNLHFSNIGCFAIRTAGCRNLTVRNCWFEFIGGAIQFGFQAPWRNYLTRYGNAIENWGACDGMTVENCSFRQIYDAAITTQSNDKTADMKRLSYCNNVFEQCEYGIELWTGSWDCRFDTVSVKGNICTDIGEGLCSQRPDKGPESFFNSKGGQRMRDCAVEDNLICGAVGSLMRCNQIHTAAYERGYQFDRNIYVNKEGNPFGLLSEDYPAHSGNLKSFPYTKETVETICSAGFEEHGEFYYL